MRDTKTSALRGLVLLILIVLLALPVNAVADTELAITFLDVGQGDCALLKCDGETMLVDTGPVGAWDHIVDVIGAERRMDYLVLTHPHLDHIGNAARIIERYPVERVILPPIEYGTKAYERAMTAIEENGIERVYPEVGDVIPLGNATVTVYGPHSVAYPEANDWSIVLMVECAGQKVLLTGDTEAAAEADMLACDDVLPLKADVLKVAHHGSDTSSTFDFVAAVAPQHAVVSCDSEEDRDYPSVDTAMTLFDCGVENVLTTEVWGDIRVTVAGNGKIAICGSK